MALTKAEALEAAEKAAWFEDPYRWGKDDRL